MKRILHSDWLTKRVRDFSRCSLRKCYLFGHIINPLFTKLVRSRWLSIGLVSVNKNGKRNSANIQPSWPSGLFNQPSDSLNSRRAHPPLPSGICDCFWKSCKCPTVGPGGSSKNPTVEHKKVGKYPTQGQH